MERKKTGPNKTQKQLMFVLVFIDISICLITLGVCSLANKVNHFPYQHIKSQRF